MVFTSKFDIKRHTFPGQHIRQYAGATRHNESDTLWLEAKQYIPRSNPNPQDGDITILGTHAVSFPKEMYEPLWDDLLDTCEAQGLRIRSIWTVDASDHGSSGIVNEHTQGDDPNFLDLSRDLLSLVNLYRQEFPQPIVGIGHSMGATALLGLAILHPRLLASLVLQDPIIGDIGNTGPMLIMGASLRPDIWPTRQAARESFKSVKAMRAWDPRVMHKWLAYGLRDTPTLLHPKPGQVTLRTTKANEAWNYGRPWFDPLPGDGTYATPRTKTKYPDGNDMILSTYPFYKSELKFIGEDLAKMRPNILYLFPENGPMSTEKAMREKVDGTGTGDGGSGGAKAGRVSSRLVVGTAHLLPFEKPLACAQATAEWLKTDMTAWAARREFEKEHRDDKSVGLVALSKMWTEQAKLFYEKSMAAKRPSKL